MVTDLPALERCMCEAVEDLPSARSSGVLSRPPLPMLHAVFGEACCLFSLMHGSHNHLFNKCGYTEVFIRSKCLMQMYRLLSAQPSFLPPSTLKPPWDGGRNCMWNTLYLSKRRCLSLFVLQGQVLYLLLLSPQKTSFSSFVCRMLWASAWWCHKPYKNRKMPEIYERRVRGVCVCVLLFSSSLQLTVASKWISDP